MNLETLSQIANIVTAAGFVFIITRELIDRSRECQKCKVPCYHQRKS